MAKQIGSLWKPKGEAKAVLSGEIELMGIKLSVCVMKNDRKDKENHPDYRIISFGIKEETSQKNNVEW